MNDNQTVIVTRTRTFAEIHAQSVRSYIDTQMDWAREKDIMKSYIGPEWEICCTVSIAVSGIEREKREYADAVAEYARSYPAEGEFAEVQQEVIDRAIDEMDAYAVGAIATIAKWAASVFDARVATYARS